MATFRKVGKRWRAEVCKKGRRASSYFDTKTAAREWASAKEFELANLVEYVATRKRVGDMFERYAKEVSPKKKGARWELVRLARFGRDAVADLLVSQVTAKDVAAWRDKRLSEVSPGTVNRELNLLSAVFEAARREWEWVTVNPVRGVQRPKNPKPRDRRISAAEITAIIDALGFAGVVLDMRFCSVPFFMFKYRATSSIDQRSSSCISFLSVLIIVVSSWFWFIFLQVL